MKLFGEEKLKTVIRPVLGVIFLTGLFCVTIFLDIHKVKLFSQYTLNDKDKNAYSVAISKAIHDNWQIPEDYINKNASFFVDITKKSEIRTFVQQQKSSDPMYDSAAALAIKKAVPLVKVRVPRALFCDFYGNNLKCNTANVVENTLANLNVYEAKPITCFSPNVKSTSAYMLHLGNILGANWNPSTVVMSNVSTKFHVDANSQVKDVEIVYASDVDAKLRALEAFKKSSFNELANVNVPEGTIGNCVFRVMPKTVYSNINEDTLIKDNNKQNYGKYRKYKG